MAAKISLRCTKCKILTNRGHWRHVREDKARAPPGDILIEKSQTVCRFMVNIHGNNGLRINKNFSISLDCAKSHFIGRLTEYLAKLAVLHLRMLWLNY